MSKELTIMCIAFCATMLMQELRIRTLKKQIEIEKKWSEYWREAWRKERSNK